MAKANKYAQAAFEVLTEMGGGPVRSKELSDAVHASGKVEESKYSYHYILKGCKDDPRFDTSVRGRIGLAEPAPVEDEVEVSDTPAENFGAENEEPNENMLPPADQVSAWGKPF